MKVAVARRAPRALRRLAVASAVALGALALTGPPTASAATTTASCSNISLVRPILGDPQCQTASLPCPPLQVCTYQARVAARALLGLGPALSFSGLRVSVAGQELPNVPVPCVTTSSTQCVGETPPVPVVGALDLAVRGDCGWVNAASLSVLATVDCTLTRTTAAATAARKAKARRDLARLRRAAR
ncbi:hypothetical protein [Conexibacter sp. SYSU D00693]|uniref:hypothetical protein n=1 Tax=Conexibacter sp. SYSU D00693 TaxID=2812560 RepID=UPI00196ABC21|nr:hypothetical protein [Conexibacter sp. SYSU D00693]